MIGSTRKVRVWAYSGPADLRKGYDGLCALVRQSMALDPLSGDLFLFANRARDRAKVLTWDGTGLCIYMKRLERGRFASLWELPAEGPLVLTTSELALFLEGSHLAGRVTLVPPDFRFETLAESPGV